MIDVLIIGSGGAGLSAALSAKTNTNNITVLSKAYVTHSQTAQAQGGINASLKENDSSSIHADETYTSSRKLSKKENIDILCKNAKDTIFYLDKLGVPFSKDSNGNFMQRPFGGSKEIRTCYSSDYTGLKILHTLYDQCIKENINFINEHLLLNLIIENEKVIGVLVLNIKTTEIIEIFSKTVIIATGGYAGLYNKTTTNSFSSTGDGLSVALRAGCDLSNMEFVQFHPTALKYTNILLSESARAEGGFLVTKDGKRFVNELSTRDEVARAILDKIETGNEVFIDVRHLGINKINETMPQERELIKDFLDLKMEEDLIPINPAAHYTMGGIKTNVSCETNISSLYACGECAQVNIHGANRLGGNSLLEIISFGRIAGANAQEASKTINLNITKSYIKKEKEELKEIFLCEKKINFYENKDKLGTMLFNKVGLYKDEKNLNLALDIVNQIKKDIPKMGLGDKGNKYNRNLVDLLEFKNSLLLSEIIIKTAIQRKESRGSHYRRDYKEESKSYEKNSLTQMKKDKLYITLECI